MNRRLWIPLAGAALLAVLLCIHRSPAGPAPAAPPKTAALPAAVEISTQASPGDASSAPVARVHAEALLNDPAIVTAPHWDRPAAVLVSPTVKRRSATRPSVLPTPTSELLIFLKPGTDPASFARDLGLALSYSLSAVSDAHVFAAATPEAAKAARERALGDPRVALAFLNERTQHVHCAFTPNDTYFPDGSPSGFHGQWHLGNGASTTHANLAGAWNRDVTGVGVLLGIVDDCLQTAHPDLAPNFVAGESWNFGNNTADPNPNPAYDGTANEDRHGTSVSGVAAARGGNGVGVTGAAPLAGLAGLRVDFPAQTTAMFVNATLFHSSGGNTTIKVKNHSYGVSATFIAAPAETQAVTDSAAAGTIHLFAAGNERGTASEDSGKTEPQNNPDAIAVAAIAANGKFSSYSSFGANVFVTAPSNGASGFGIMTTDRIGNRGYNSTGNGDGDSSTDLAYTTAFGGTSSATPLTTGIMALGKQVRPNLDVRFAKHALARSCTQVDPTDNTVTGGGDGATAGSAWKTNAAGFKFNQNYGFGMVNADAFITKLLQLDGVTPMGTESTGTIAVGAAIPDNTPSGVTRTFTLASTSPLEQLLVSMNVTHTFDGDLEATLTSPSGTTRRLFSRSTKDPTANINWTFETNDFWGENPAGVWTLKLADMFAVDTGTWNSFAVTARTGTVISDTTPPSVVSINRAAASPTNAASVTYTVTFSEPVTGVDAGDFALTTTGTIAGASITSVTGSVSIYTVTVNTGSGDGTIRLDLADDDSIQDTMGLQLGGAGAGNGSFTSGQSYTLDRIAPSVTTVTSTAADGAYRAAGVVPVTVTFTEAVTVTGTPRITLATGGAGTLVNYSSGSGTATLTFTYTVGAAQNSPDLDYFSTSALALNGGTIRDAAGNNASLTLASPGAAGSLGANKNIVIDTVNPGAPGTPSGSPNPNNTGSFLVSWTAASDGAGSGIASYTVQRSDNGAAFNIVASGSAALSLAQSGLAQGNYRYQVRAVDVAGNAGAFSSISTPVVVDTTAPAAPSTPDLDPASDSGTSNTDNITRFTSLSFSGTAEAGATVQLFVDGVGGATTVAAGGAWTLVAPSVAAGVRSVTAVATDPAGNVSPASGALSVTVDLTLPVATVPDLDPASDTGSSSTDNLTKLTTLSFSGTVEAGSTVQLFVDGAPGATTLAVGTAWTVSAASLTAGVHLFSARATDLAGNLGPLSADLSVTIDTTPPAAPSTPDLAAASDNGASSTDNITSLTSLSFSGTAEAGSTVQLFVDGVGGATTVAAGGAWTLVAPSVAAGVRSVNAVATDPAGNASPASAALSVTVDTTAPAAPSAPDLAAATDTGASNSDNVTSSLLPQFTVTGEAGGTMTLFAGVTSVGTASDSGGGSYSLTINATAFANSAVVFTARITDAAGNIGAVSPGLTVTFDTTAPVASVPDLDAASDTGSSSTDNLTNLTTLSFSGSSEAGSTVQLFIDGIGGATTTATAGGAWTLVSPVLGTGTHSAAAQAFDAAGNIGPLSSALTVTIDTSAPAAPSTPDLAAASDTGASSTDNITSLTSLSFSGSAEAGATVQLFVDGVGGATTVAAGGVWTLVAPSVSAGVHAIRAQATDVAGNIGALSAPLSVTVDTTAPAVPSVPDLDTTSDTGTSSTDNITSTTAPSFSGTAEAGATVKLFANGVQVGTTIATVGGTYTVTSSALADGAYSFTASAGDLAGNTSAASLGLAVTIDTSAPAAPSVPDLDAASDTGASSTDNLTNLATLSFSGTAEAGSTVQLLVDGSPVVSGTAAGGTWTLVTPALAAGPHNVAARASDAAGNLGPASTALAITIDLTAPAAPSTPDLDPASDTGASNSDNLTNLTTLSFSGSAEAGSTVQLFVDGAPAGSVVAAAGTWTITAGPLAAGTRNITARATDAAGNSSGLSGTLPVTIDLTAPLAPSAPDLDPASDSGASNTDNLTNLTTLVFTGTAEVGATVQLFVDGVGGATTIAAGGAWTLSAASVAAGPHSITARASDAAGNASPVSPALSITVDTSAPAAPSTPDLDAASDTGASNTDNLTSLTTLSFSGSAEAGATVQLLVDGNPSGSIVATTGSWTIVAGPLAAGTHSVTARATDPAGNTGAASPALSVTIDTTLPATLAAPDLDAASDTGTSSTDNLTSTTTPSFSGTAEAGATVKLFANGVQVGSAVATAGGAYTVVSSALADGTHTMTVTATDAAGNASAASPGLPVTIDTAAPAAPSAPDLDPASDTGASATDNLTKATTLSFSGSAEAGSTVQLFVDGAGGATTTAGGGGAWTLSAAGVSEGTHSITARARDAAGNLGPASAPLSVTVDTTLPAAPSVPDLDAASDTGASSTDNITSLTTLSFSGSAEAGASVQLFIDGNPGNSVTAAAGTWTLTAGPLAAGIHAVTARATDPAGNLGPASAPLSVTIDTTPPAAPSAPDLDPASDTGASNTDNITKLTTLTFTGTTEAGATVQLFVDGNPGPSVAAAGTSWTIVAVLSAGVHAVTAQATDAAGNLSPASAPLSVTIDTTPPAAPSAPDLDAASDTGASSTDNITKLASLSFSGSAEAGATVQLFVDGNPAGSVVAAAGSWTIVTPPLTEGAHAVTAVATDPAGNASAASAALPVTIDLSAPAAPPAPDLDAASDTGASSTDNITKATTLSFSGTAEIGATVRLLVDGSPVALTTAVAGTWTLSAVGVAEGVHSVTATATDAAGNASAASAPLSVTVDTTAPAAPSTPDLDAASDTGASNTDNVTSLTTLSFSGTAEAGATVQIFVDGVGGATTTAAGGTWTLGASGVAPGVRFITARATDAAGNSSVTSGALSVTIDSGIPTAPSVPDLDPASDTGISSTDNLTKLTTLTFTGTAEAGSTVRLYVDGVSAGTAVATGGAWTITASSIAPGVRTFTATALDTAGNLSPASAGLAVTIDATPPLTPAAPTLDAASDDGPSSTDAITTLHVLSFSGNAEAGALVRLFAGAGQVGSVTAGPAGDYTIVSSPLADGPWAITVTATDPAGNVSAASAPLAVIVDNTPPPAGTVLDGAGADINFQNSATTITAHWTGFTDPESGILKYEVAIGTTPGGTQVEGFTDVGTATSASRGPFALTEGTTYFVTVRATNPVGLQSTATSDGVTVDVTPPAPPGGFVAIPGDASATLYWLASPSADLAFYRVWWKPTGAAWGAATLIDTLSGTSAVVGGLVNGSSFDFRLRAVDAAGNESTDLFSSTTPQPAIQIQGGGSFATIQAAIDAAAPGQTILIGPGTYVGDLVLRPGVSLQGYSPYFTILQGSGLGPVITVQGVFGSGLSSTISQLTVTGGLTGISSVSADLTVRNGVIHHVLGDGISAGTAGRLTALNVTSVSNTGDGIQSLGQTTIRDTIAGENGAMGFNLATAAAVTYSDAWLNGGGNYSTGAGAAGNLSTPAIFTNEAGFDYTTPAASPTVDAGDPADDFSGEPLPNGGRVDMGGYGNTAFAPLTTGPTTPPPAAGVLGGGGGGGGGCGLLGLEVLGFLAALRLKERRRNRRRELL